MHLLLGPLVSAIAEGERMGISFGPGCMFREQQFSALMMVTRMRTSANKISILLMQLIQHLEVRLTEQLAYMPEFGYSSP